MEIVICCFCSLVCFLAGAVVSGGYRISTGELLKRTKTEEDELSQDIASMLRYDAGKQEENKLE